MCFEPALCALRSVWSNNIRCIHKQSTCVAPQTNTNSHVPVNYASPFCSLTLLYCINSTRIFIMGNNVRISLTFAWHREWLINLPNSFVSSVASRQNFWPRQENSNINPIAFSGVDRKIWRPFLCDKRCPP